jgi:hypothetical protein
VPDEDLQDALGLLQQEEQQQQQGDDAQQLLLAGELLDCEQHTRTSLELARMLQQAPQEQQLQQVQLQHAQQHQQQQLLVHLQQVQMQEQVPQQLMYQQYVPNDFVFGQQQQQQQQDQMLHNASTPTTAAGVENTAVQYMAQGSCAARVTTGMPAAADVLSPFAGMPLGLQQTAAAAADAGLDMSSAAGFLGVDGNSFAQQQQQQSLSRGSEGASGGVQNSGSTSSGAAAAGAAAAAAAADGGAGKPVRRRKPSDAQREAHRRFRQRRKNLVGWGRGWGMS